VCPSPAGLQRRVLSWCDQKTVCYGSCAKNGASGQTGAQGCHCPRRRYYLAVQPAAEKSRVISCCLQRGPKRPSQGLWDRQSVSSWPNEPKAAPAASLPSPNEPERVQRGALKVRRGDACVAHMCAARNAEKRARQCLAPTKKWWQPVHGRRSTGHEEIQKQDCCRSARGDAGCP
jgi:hypothetical protein